MLILNYSAAHRTRIGLLLPITLLFLDRFLIFLHRASTRRPQRWAEGAVVAAVVWDDGGGAGTS